MIVHPRNLETDKQFGLRHGLKVCTGTRYIGGFIGDEESKRDWLQDRKSKWENNICTISKTAGKYPQESNLAVVRAIQSERIFLQRVTKNTRYSFAGVEKLLRETFLSCLFFRKSISLPPIVGTLSTILVKKAGLGLQNPVTSADEKSEVRNV